LGILAALAAARTSVFAAQAASAGSEHHSHDGRTGHARHARDNSGDGRAATPIKHLVVIFQENVSFDHHFGSCPNATNPAGEPAFHASPRTPSVNGLSGPLLTNNPNSANPQRLGRSQALR
jgi:phospholipase C